MMMEITGKFAEAEALLSTPEPDLRWLAYVLRHREMWPVGFRWDYTSCETCAMGLAWQIGLIANCNVFAFSDAFKMNIFDVSSLCNHADVAINKRFSDITPEDIAFLIEQHLARSAGK